MEKYFDGFLYFANWGSCELHLRLPATALSLETAQRYCLTDTASVRERSGKLIFSFQLNEEFEECWDDFENGLSMFLPIRDEIARGDLRSLYLGWLLSAQTHALDDTEEEPPVPPNLGKLTRPQTKLAEFLLIDSDLIAVAARNSPVVNADVPNRDELASWVRSLPESEKNEILIRAISGQEIGMELQSRFSRSRTVVGTVGSSKPRTVIELLEAAEIYREERQAKKKRQAALEREAHLDSLAGPVEAVWDNVEGLVASAQTNNYDLAIERLIDLRELAQRDGDQGGFNRRLALLRKQHVTKRAFTEKLKKKGF